MPVVPQSTISNTRVQAQPTAYQQIGGVSPDAFGAPQGQGLQSLGKEVAGAGETIGKIAMAWQQREQQVQEFDTLSRFDKFNGEQARLDEQMQRQAPSNGLGYVQARTKAYDESADQFLQTVPERERPKYAERLTRLREHYGTRALDFQFKQQDQFFKNELGNTVVQNETYLDQDPKSLGERQAQVLDMIDKSGLPENEKEAHRQAAKQRLQEATYRAEKRRDPGKAASSLGVGSDADMDRVAAKVFQVESGGRADAKNPNSSATGKGQFIEETWLSMVQKYKPELMQGKSKAEVLALRGDGALSEELGRHYLEEGRSRLVANGLPVTPGNLYLTYFLGMAGGTNVLSVDPTTPIEKIVKPEVLTANPFLKGKTTGEVAAWADQKMGDKTPIKPGGDPRFKDIPYERKLALTYDAQREIKQAENATSQLRQEEQRKQFNDLLVGLYDGSKGAADIQAARDEGWMSDFNQIAQAQNVLKQRVDKIGSLNEALTQLANPTKVWDPTDTGDKKRMDAIFDAGQGAQKLFANDQKFIQEGLMPLVQQTKMIPANAMGALKAMLRDSQRMDQAYQILDQMDRTVPQVFQQDVDNDTYKKLLAWRSTRDFYTPEEQRKMMLEASSPSKQAAREEMLDAGKKLAADIPDSTILDHFDPGWLSAQPSAPVGSKTVTDNSGKALATNAMRQDFQTLFAEQFALVGDKDQATQNALKLMEKKWGSTDTGADRRLMPYPPEKYYGPINGSFEWMKKQADDDIKSFIRGPDVNPAFLKTEYEKVPLEKPGPKGETATFKQVPKVPDYWLVSDDKTEAAIRSNQPPGYQVVFKDEFGRLQALTRKDGAPMRLTFDKSPFREQISREAEEQRKRAEAMAKNPPITLSPF